MAKKETKVKQEAKENGLQAAPVTEEMPAGPAMTDAQRAAAAKKAQCEALAGEIRRAAAEETYLSLTELSAKTEMDKTAALELLDRMQRQSEYEDVHMYRGGKDRYYYSYPALANNYVRACVLAEEDDAAHTIAEIVRYDSKTFPRATKADFFTRFPYHYTLEQVEAQLRKMKRRKAYNDIEMYTSKHGNLYIFSTKSLSRVHAEALVEMGEDITLWM